MQKGGHCAEKALEHKFLEQNLKRKDVLGTGKVNQPARVKSTTGRDTTVHFQSLGPLS